MCIVHTLATIAIVSVMGISVVVQPIVDEVDRNKLTITLVTTTSVCFAFFGVPVLPLVDGGVLKILGRNKDQYGRQRMFGSISFGVASSLVGFITDWTDDMNAIFYIYSFSAICFILVCGNTQFKSERIEDEHHKPYLVRTRSSNTITPTSNTTTNNSNIKTISTSNDYNNMTSVSSASPASNMNNYSRRKMKQFQVDPYDEVGIDLDSSQIRQNEIQRLIQFATESSIIEAVNLSNPPSHRRNVRPNVDEPATLMQLLKKPDVSLFFLTMMLMGASLNMVVSFLFIYLKQDLGASSSQVGLTGLIGSSTELLFFFYSKDVSFIFSTKKSISNIFISLNNTAYSIIWYQKLNHFRSCVDHYSCVCIHNYTQRTNWRQHCSWITFTKWCCILCPMGGWCCSS